MSNSLFNLPQQQRTPHDGARVVPPGAGGNLRITASNRNHLERLLAMDGNAIHSIARTNPKSFTPVTPNVPLRAQVGGGGKRKGGGGKGGRQMNKTIVRREKKVTAGTGSSKPTKRGGKK